MNTHQRKQLKSANDLMRKIAVHNALLNQYKKQDTRDKETTAMIDNLEIIIKRYQKEFDNIISPNT